jgi:hypothetical protein
MSLSLIVLITKATNIITFAQFKTPEFINKSGFSGSATQYSLYVCPVALGSWGVHLALVWEVVTWPFILQFCSQVDTLPVCWVFVSNLMRHHETAPKMLWLHPLLPSWGVVRKVEPDVSVQQCHISPLARTSYLSHSVSLSFSS